MKLKGIIKNIVKVLDYLSLKDEINKNYIDEKNQSVPDISGTWNQSYKVFRVENDEFEKIQKNEISKDYIKDFQFNFIIVKESTVKIKQHEDSRFGILFQPPAKLRAGAGISPFVLNQKEKGIWTMSLSDFDDNGFFRVDIFLNDDGTCDYMRGIYTETGFNNFTIAQAPTVAICEFNKIDESLELQDTKKRNFNKPIKRSELSINKNIDFTMFGEIVDFEKIEFFYDTNLLYETEKRIISPTQYEIYFQGPLFTSIGKDKVKFVGYVDSINKYSVSLGVNLCDVDVYYYLFDEKSQFEIDQSIIEKIKPNFKGRIKEKIKKMETESQNKRFIIATPFVTYASVALLGGALNYVGRSIAKFAFKTTYQGTQSTAKFALGSINTKLSKSEGKTLEDQKISKVDYNASSNGKRTLSLKADSSGPLKLTLEMIDEKKREPDVGVNPKKTTYETTILLKEKKIKTEKTIVSYEGIPNSTEIIRLKNITLERNLINQDFLQKITPIEKGRGKIWLLKDNSVENYHFEYISTSKGDKNSVELTFPGIKQESKTAKVIVTGFR